MLFHFFCLKSFWQPLLLSRIWLCSVSWTGFFRYGRSLKLKKFFVSYCLVEIQVSGWCLTKAIFHLWEKSSNEWSVGAQAPGAGAVVRKETMVSILQSHMLARHSCLDGLLWSQMWADFENMGGPCFNFSPSWKLSPCRTDGARALGRPLFLSHFRFAGLTSKF